MAEIVEFSEINLYKISFQKGITSTVDYFAPDIILYRELTQADTDRLVRTIGSMFFASLPGGNRRGAKLESPLTKLTVKYHYAPGVYSKYMLREVLLKQAIESNDATLIDQIKREAFVLPYGPIIEPIRWNKNSPLYPVNLEP